ncbi:MAG: hypothetical protein KJ648_07565 [Candidatus Omnitrophica bacterium]|nr:hypothetical protein [Candidatus Omnitrophota bacterium]
MNSFEAFEPLLGGKVLRVETAETRVVITTDKGTLVGVLEGECCSESFFTDPTQFHPLVGSRLLAVEDRSEGTPSFCAPARQESMIWSFLVFTTDRGHVTIDWRNDSNGYYSGELVWFTG